MTHFWHIVSRKLLLEDKMKHICELQNILEQYFNWNKSRLTVLVNLLIGLFVIRTVNLSEQALVLSSKAQISSNYKRIQRFFN